MSDSYFVRYVYEKLRELDHYVEQCDDDRIYCAYNNLLSELEGENELNEDYYY